MCFRGPGHFGIRVHLCALERCIHAGDHVERRLRSACLDARRQCRPEGRTTLPSGILRRKITVQLAGLNAADRVVQFVHGATTPGTAAFGFDHKDYNWMAFLARNGFDVWAMDMSGYGSSPRPMMDDPCNVDPQLQEILLKRPLAAPCAPH